jgi:transglutaminase-like putative cysteine protease
MRADSPAILAPMLDHTGLDLRTARHLTYRVEQCFRYTYDTPVTALSQRLVVVPRRRHGDLHRRTHVLDVTGAQTRRRTCQDSAGNTVVRVNAARVEHSVEFRILAILETAGSGGRHLLPAAALRDPRLRQPTRLTAASDRLAAMAAELLRPGGSPLDLAERICAATHAALTYQHGVTDVRTTAAEALAGGRGVCQDYAHIMVALCHLAHLRARYVSGHLLGQGGTHAWVEVIVPHRDAAMAVPFDPCHGRTTDKSYLTVAVGRDYADIAPTSGSYIGSPGGRLTSTRRVGVIAVDAPLETSTPRPAEPPQTSRRPRPGRSEQQAHISAPPAIHPDPRCA